jgi:hypothetical protein
MPIVSLFLLLWLLTVWWLWVIACAAQQAVADARAGNSTRGVSIFPGFPVFPLVAWGVAILVDRFFSPIGSLSIAFLHVIFCVALCVSILRDRAQIKVLRLRPDSEV